MAKYLVEKNGPLRGEVAISGAKNAVLPILAATILAEGPCEILEVPALRDVDVMCRLLRGVGFHVEEYYEEGRILVEPRKLTTDEVPRDLVKKMRASFLAMGPLLAKAGQAMVAAPGGCTIGARPIDLHLKGFRALGATVDDGGDPISARADKLTAGKVYLDFPSVGATENIMMAATLAEGVTVIENAAEEPEIVDLANFLNKMGAKIKGAGTDTVRIEGVQALHGAKHAVIPDRIETGTFMVAAAITRGDVLIKNALPDHVKAVTAKLMECGVTVEDLEEGIRVRGDRGPLASTDIKTMPYPGFPTDMQSQFMALMTTVKGTSVIVEKVFENRYMHIGELNRMGAGIRIEGNNAVIPGEQRLHGAQVIATDLRAGAALVLAGLRAEGVTEVSEIYHIERGYADFIGKLQALGAKITKVED